MKRVLSLTKHLKSFLTRFGENQRGSLAIITGITMTVIVLAVMIGVDIARGYFARSRIAYSLDAALLAVSGELPALPTDTAINDYAVRFFKLNFPNNYLGATVNGINVTVDRQLLSPDTISMSAMVTVPTIFGGAIRAFSGGQSSDNFVINASAKAQRQNKVIEVALALDNTGSMGTADAGGGQTRLQALKDAANTLVTTLFTNTNSTNAPYISVVPFTFNVNMKNYSTFLLNPGQPTTAAFPGNDPWAGCVDERLAVGAFDDTPPDSVHFDPFYNKTKNYNQFNQLVTTTPNFGCTIAKIQALSNNETSIHTLINSMTANGNTTIYKGLLWGWRTISPRWQGKWDGVTSPLPSNRPLPYNTPNLTKIIVLLTDGDNDVNSSSCSPKSVLVSTTKYDGAYPCNTDLDTILTNVCVSVKAQNIIIYTIGLGPDVQNSTRVRGLLGNCATDPSKFKVAPTSQDLQDAFRVIASELSVLRLTQ